MKNRKLTKNQKRFVNEYLIDLNATRAYKVAYKSVKKDETAAVNGSRLLRNAKVKKYLEQRMKEREKRTEITQDMVLKELAKIGFANGSDFAKVVEKIGTRPIYNGKGEKIGEEEFTYKTVEIINTDDLPKDKKAAIAGIKETKHGIVVESCDKVKALELIGRHLGMFTDKIEHSGSMNINNPYEGLSTEELKRLAKMGDADD